jgi:hypothetical protein
VGLISTACSEETTFFKKYFVGISMSELEMLLLFSEFNRKLQAEI